MYLTFLGSSGIRLRVVTPLLNSGDSLNSSFGVSSSSRTSRGGMTAVVRRLPVVRAALSAGLREGYPWSNPQMGCAGHLGMLNQYH